MLNGWLNTGRFNAELKKKATAFISIKHLNHGALLLSFKLVTLNTFILPKLGAHAIHMGDEVMGVVAGDPTTQIPA